MPLATGWCMASGAAGTFHTSRQSSLKYAQPPIPSRCHRGRIVRKRLPAGRGEILRRRERIAFATADAKGEPIAEGGGARIGWRRPACPIQGDRLDGVGAAGSEPIDAIRRSLEHGHAIVLVAQPVDQCSAVDDDFDVFAGGRVLDGCRQRLGLELVDQSGEGFLEMGMGGVAGRFRRAGLEDVVEAVARVLPVCGDGVGRRQHRIEDDAADAFAGGRA